MKKAHALETMLCKKCKQLKLHEISWLIDHEHRIYEELAECLKCGTVKTRPLSEKEMKTGGGVK